MQFNPLGSIWESNLAAGSSRRLRADSTSGRLVASCKGADRKLQYALVLHAKGSADEERFVFRPCPEHFPSAAICVGPTVHVGPSRFIVVTVLEQETAVTPESIETFQRCYDLTAGEVRLLALILEGHGASGAAKVLGISANTTKTQLSSIFHKTGVTNQLLLARLFFLTPF